MFINSISIHSLRNAGFINFSDGVVSIGSRHNLTSFGLKPAQDGFIATLAPLNAQYATEQGSSLTEKIVAADARRDKAVVGILTVIIGHGNHFDAAIGEAAGRLEKVFAKYGSSIQTLPYLDQSGAIKSLAEDLQSAPADADVTKLGLGAWVAEMKAANTEFVTLLSSRTTEKSQKPSEKMLDLRQNTILAWQNLCKKISAVNELTPSAALNAYAAELNTYIEEYNQLIGGKGGNDKTEPKA